MSCNKYFQKSTFSVSFVGLIVVLTFKSTMTFTFEPLTTMFEIEMSSFKDLEPDSNINNIAFETEIEDQSNEISLNTSTITSNDDNEKNSNMSTTLNFEISNSSVIPFNELTSSTTLKSVFENSLFTSTSSEPIVSNLIETNMIASKNQEFEKNSESESTSNKLSATVSLNDATDINFQNNLTLSVCKMFGMIVCNHTALICLGKGEIDCDVKSFDKNELDKHSSHNNFGNKLCKLSNSLKCHPLPLFDYCTGKGICKPIEDPKDDKLEKKTYDQNIKIVVILAGLAVFIMIVILVAEGLMKWTKLKVGPDVENGPNSSINT